MDWNLDQLYRDFGEAFQKDEKQLQQKLQEALEDDFSDAGADAWVKRLETFTDMVSQRIRLGAYANLRTSIESDLPEAVKARDRIQALQPEMVRYAVRMKRALADTDIDALLEENEALQPFAFFLREQKEDSGHLLSDAEEELFALLTQTGAQAFQQLKELLTAKHMIDIELDGKQQTLPLPAIRNLAYHKDAAVRKAAFQAELDSYPRIEDSVAAALNAIKGESITMAEKRGFTSPLAKTLHTSRMDGAILQALWTAIDEAKPVFQKYLRHKAKLLGHEGGLPFYDLLAPVGEVDLAYTFSEAADFVVKNFHAYSTALGDYAQKAVDAHWIDVYPKKGKRGGAFCSNLHPIKQSRFMLNFTGSYSNLTTLAHELGHGWHGHVLSNEPFLNSTYPMPLAETASTFCELLVNSAAMKEADTDTRAAILENSIAGVTQTCIDIRSRFLFEDAVFAKRKEGSLSVDELKECMQDAQKEAYGEGLDPEVLHPYMWINKPHYFMPGLDYYNFPYAFGNLFAIGLGRLYREDPAGFPEKYDAMLALTGKANVADVAQSMGIDLTKPDFFRASLKQVEEEIDEWIRLTEV